MQIQEQIEEKLKATFAPLHLAVVNESGMHNVPAGSESHFNALVVSASFEGQSPVQRQRAVYGAIAHELRESVHAFTMKTLTPAEWQAQGGDVRDSPDCRGGAKSEGLFQK